MRVDTNTNGHRQWFYFSVRNQQAGVVRFNIYRFKKKFSLFQRGMKPYVCSVKSKMGWKPNCNKISYRVQKFVSDNKNQVETSSFYLSFQYKFEHPQDEVYFASGIPYTVSFLNQRLLQLKIKSKDEIEFDLVNVGKSLCGQNLQMISINSIDKPQVPNYIIINARTHAGETSSSWVLDGLLQKIVNDDSIKKWIIQNNICLKILPMLNPDGVFMGNYRTGVLGDDFNRKFATGKKQLFPQIHALKKVIADCKKNGKVFLFLDLHGHSVLKNSFIYGPPQSLFVNHPLRNLPFSLWHSSKYFRLSSCKFKFDKDMAETARIYFQIKQNILSYTCEISLGLYYQGTTTIQMLEDDYKSLGQSMIVSISQLMTKQKVTQFQNNIQQSNTSLQKLTQTNEVITQKRTLPKQRKQQSLSKYSQNKTSAAKRQNQRQTVIQKIKNIKKQLVQQIQGKKEYSSNYRQKFDHKIAKESKNKINKIKIDISNSIQKKIQKIEPLTDLKKETMLIPKRKSTFDPFELTQGTNQQEGTPVRAVRFDSKKNQRQAQFKIRRRSDILKILPESIRKKLGPKLELGFTSTKYLNNHQQQQEYILERSATFDSPYLSTQIAAIETNETNQQQLPDLQIINQNFSEEYQSINDSDNQSQDLGIKQKQYLIECIKNNKKLKTNQEETQQLYLQEQQAEDTTNSTAININGFKQIRFKFIEDSSMKTMLPFRSTKRQMHKFRDVTHKSLGRNLYENEQALMPTMVQRKQLNQRATQKKNIRQPYFLVQIKNKNH